MFGIFENGPADCDRAIRVVYLSVMNRDGVFLGRALESMGDLHVGMRVVCADSEDLDENEEAFMGFLSEVRDCDILLIGLHGDESYFRKYHRMMQVASKAGVDVLYEGSLPESNSENRILFRHSDEEYARARLLLGLGGEVNFRSLLRWIEREIGGADVVVPDAVISRTEGFCHPDMPDDADILVHRAFLDQSKPVIGVMTHQTTVVKGRVAPVHRLVRDLESKGANVISVYCASSPNELTGSIGSEAVIRRYFMDGDQPVVDAVVMTMGFSQINMNNVDGDPDAENFLIDLGVPVIQAQGIMRSVSEWEDDIVGMTSAEIGTSVIWPEYDGQVISVPLMFTSRGEDGKYVADSVEDRVHRISSLAIAWAELSRKDPSERRVAILLNMYPPTNDRVGGASGLDTFESIRMCLIGMESQGYVVDRIPENGNEIVNEVLAGVTSDTRWVPEDEIPSRAADMMDVSEYMGWFDSLSPKAREGMVRSWGEPPGPISVHDGRFIIPGVRNGNVFIGTQPNRGQHEQAETLYHDPRVVMPHQYLAYYRWLAEDFKADMVVHMGTHGTLEWLPGKGQALSRDDYPDVVLDTMPNVSPYIIDDPGEGVQCKRRTNSVLIGHMVPALTRAGGYDELMDLDGVLQEYLNSRSTMQDEKRMMLMERIHGLVRGLDMFKELGLDEECDIGDVDERVDLIYDYVADIKDALIKDGLHVMGKVPEGERMREMVYSLSRLRNGSVPSLRGAVAESMGLDLDSLLDDKSGFTPGWDVVNGALVDRIDGAFNALIDSMDGVSFDREASLSVAEGMFETVPQSMVDSIAYVCDHIYPGICRMTDEVDNFLKGIGGRYVPPGPSGAPTRGNAHLLPTGTNFYSIDPSTIPSESSWIIGSKMARQMIDRYIEDNGRYPESIGIVVWATDTMKTGGDDIAYIFSLMGIRPTWSAVGGRVTGMEVIPLEELGRPRIDVMPRISGLFRDSFPGLSDMLVDALGMISELDEDDEANYYRKHLKEDMERYISEGMDSQQARDMASIRVFGDPPGQHGNGVSVLIASSQWDTIDQIAETYATWGAHAYGGKWKGEKVPTAFKRRVGALEVTVKNHNTREFDLLDIDDDYDSLGGMNAAVRTFGGHKPVSFMGDSSDVDRLGVRTVEEETAFVMRSRVLNPVWADGLKPHGYKGAMELSKLTEFMLGWSATTDSIEPWMFRKVTESYILDEEWREWLNDNNPYALKEMIEDMLEAADRGLWDAPQDILDELRDLYLETEGDLEGFDPGM
ncbi:MAG: cobaltochelatase subunit CobN [Candidatus Methanomethylophilaceae archaeon]|nr:cobaltochelatase subunit CobN [Candidatus Methanomethylophilaceae archaeon]